MSTYDENISDSQYRFYVYAYLRTVDSDTAKAGTLYYIGKGQGRRAYDSTHRTCVPKDQSKIVFYQHNLLEKDAYELETAYIKLFGRVDTGTGILRNMTDGGDGPFGYKRSEKSIKKQLETRIKKYGSLNTTTPESIRKGQMTKIERYGTLDLTTESSHEKARATRQHNPYRHTAESIQKWRESREKNLYIISKDTREKISKAKRGYKRSLESRIKQSETRKQNGNTNTPESKAKSKETWRLKRLAKQQDRPI